MKGGREPRAAMAYRAVPGDEGWRCGGLMPRRGYAVQAARIRRRQRPGRLLPGRVLRGGGPTTYTSSSPTAPSSPSAVGAAAAATARRPGSVCSRGVIGEGEEPSHPRDPADGPIRLTPQQKGPTPFGSATSRRQEGRRAAGGDGGGGCRAAGGDAEVRRTDGTLARGDRQRERLEPLVRQREREVSADAEGLRGAVGAAARNPPAERLGSAGVGLPNSWARIQPSSSWEQPELHQPNTVCDCRVYEV